MEGLAKLYQVTLYLLPLFGLILLALLAFLAVRFIQASGKINEILDKSKLTVDQVNSTLREIEKPLSTVAKISGGVDVLYGYGEKHMKRLLEQITEVFNYLKQWLSSKNNDKKEEIISNEE